MEKTENELVTDGSRTAVKLVLIGVAGGTVLSLCSFVPWYRMTSNSSCATGAVLNYSGTTFTWLPAGEKCAEIG